VPKQRSTQLTAVRRVGSAGLDVRRSPRLRNETLTQSLNIPSLPYSQVPPQEVAAELGLHDDEDEQDREPCDKLTACHEPPLRLWAGF